MFFQQLNMHTNDTAHAHEHVQLVHVEAWTGAKAEGTGSLHCQRRNSDFAELRAY